MRVRMGASERKLFAIRPKIEEKPTEEIGNENVLENSSKTSSDLVSEPIYNKDNKIMNYENNLLFCNVSNESLSESEALTLVTEELKKKYPVEIVAEALRIYLFKKMEQKIYSVEKYIIGICKNLIKNKKSRIRKIYKRRKREEFEEQQQQKFKQMAQDKAEREQDSNYVMFNEMTTARYERMNVQITDDMYFDWMNELEEETIEEPQTGLVDKFAPYQTIIFKL